MTRTRTALRSLAAGLALAMLLASGAQAVGRVNTDAEPDFFGQGNPRTVLPDGPQPFLPGTNQAGRVPSSTQAASAMSRAAEGGNMGQIWNSSYLNRATQDARRNEAPNDAIPGPGLATSTVNNSYNQFYREQAGSNMGSVIAGVGIAAALAAVIAAALSG